MLNMQYNSMLTVVLNKALDFGLHAPVAEVHTAHLVGAHDAHGKGLGGDAARRIRFGALTRILPPRAHRLLEITAPARPEGTASGHLRNVGRGVFSRFRGRQRISHYVYVIWAKTTDKWL